jgi:hypothetical protein
MKGQATAIQGTLITLLMTLTTAIPPARGQYAGGSGTADDPYLIATAEQLNAIGLRAEDWDKHFRLTANIDMNDLGETPVNLIPEFQGVFDGNDHTIANLSYLAKDEDSPPEPRSVDAIGLFRRITGFDALVKDLGLIDPNLRPDPACIRPVDRIGALVGVLDQGWIRNCHVKGGHVLGHNDVGGLVGECRNDAAVSECWSTAEVSGDFTGIGGLVGYAAWASIWSCHARARVSGAGDVGGLVGTTWPECVIEDCFSTGTVTGSQAGGLVGFLQGSVSRSYSTASVSGNFSLGGLAGMSFGLIRTSWAGGEVAGLTQLGGLVGVVSIAGFLNTPFLDAKVTDSYATGAVRGNIAGGLIGFNEGTLERCYSTGTVTGVVTGSVSGPSANIVIGGLVGYDKFVPEWDILGCFWDTTTSGVDASKGGTGMTTPQMQDIAVYLAAGWDFTEETANGAEDLWTMPDDGPAYPKLAWEEHPANGPADPNGVD